MNKAYYLLIIPALAIIGWTFAIVLTIVAVPGPDQTAHRVPDCVAPHGKICVDRTQGGWILKHQDREPVSLPMCIRGGDRDRTMCVKDSDFTGIPEDEPPYIDVYSKYGL